MLRAMARTQWIQSRLTCDWANATAIIADVVPCTRYRYTSQLYLLYRVPVALLLLHCNRVFTHRVQAPILVRFPLKVHQGMDSVKRYLLVDAIVFTRQNPYTPPPPSAWLVSRSWQRPSYACVYVYMHTFIYTPWSDVAAG